MQEQVRARLLMLTRHENIAVAEAIALTTRRGEMDGHLDGGTRHSEQLEDIQSRSASGLTTSRKLRSPLVLVVLTLLVAGALVPGIMAGTNRPGDEEGLPPPVAVVTSEDDERVWQRLQPWVNRSGSEQALNAFRNSSSPQSLAMEWLLLNDTIALSESTMNQEILERYALAVMYYLDEWSTRV